MGGVVSSMTSVRELGRGEGGISFEGSGISHDISQGGGTLGRGEGGRGWRHH